jgi:hypothetical protein
MTELSRLFVPLSPDERKNFKERVEALLSNEDFIYLMRDIFEKSPPLAPTFTDRTGNDTHAAAKADGERNFSRLIMKLFIEKQNGTRKIKKATEQA